MPAFVPSFLLLSSLQVLTFRESHLFVYHAQTCEVCFVPSTSKERTRTHVGAIPYREWEERQPDHDNGRGIVQPNHLGATVD